ncbi:MAG: lamin tail domain-containing protein [bacterium]|nr:lamin tail domain-containing protein [bacterium]
MENRKFLIFKIFLFIIPLITGFFLNIATVYGYEVETHAFLTSEVVAFYNRHTKQPIAKEFYDYIIDGARLEDNAPRFSNHFYDPVNNQGLHDLGFRGRMAKDWAQNDSAQTALLYRAMPQTEASLLSLAQISTIQETFDHTDFTWERALELYKDGEKEDAFFVLGHIIHLIEDMAVPDHTRNDAHPPFDYGGSPYENWTSKITLENKDSDLTLRLVGKYPIVLNDLEFYFDGLANYSNNNFYSKDSIFSYANPKPIKLVGGTDLPLGYVYGLYNDGEKEFKLVFGKNKNEFDWLIEDNLQIVKLTNNQLTKPVLEDYWSRLSTKAVQYGAGVIDLFFKEVAKESDKKVVEQKASYFAQIVDVAQGFIAKANNQFDGFEEVATIPLDIKDKEEEEVPFVPRRDVKVKIIKEESKAAPLSEVVKTDSVATQSFLQTAGSQDATAQVCAFDIVATPVRKSLIINEVAWMGTPKSANDEWIELKNISDNLIDISGWQLYDEKSQIKIIFNENATVAPHKFLLLERTDDDSVSGIAADTIYVGALSNTDEGLRLFNRNCELQDEVMANPEWSAGNSAERRTMERLDDLSWHTYSGDGTAVGGKIYFGTPRAENSEKVEISKEVAAVVEVPIVSNILNHVVISEVQITGGTGKTTNDFIELYNPTNTAFNLNGYRLVKRTKTGTTDTSIKSWTSDAFIPPRGFYLWANSGYTDIAITPDITTSGTIADDNGIALRLGAEDTGVIIDSVAWGVAENIFIEGTVFAGSIDAHQSIERKAWQNNCISGEFLGHGCDTNNNQNDFALRTVSQPQNSSSPPEPRAVPVTVNNFNTKYASTTLGIIFNWEESRDYAGATSSIKYVIQYATSSEPLKDLGEVFATTTYRFITQEIGVTYNFAISAKDNYGLRSDTATTSLFIPSFLNNVLWYADPRTSSTTALELRYNSYPFIPNIFGKQPAWTTLHFYKNKDAETIPYFYSGLSYASTPDGVFPKQYGEWGNFIDGALKLKYPNCAGADTRLQTVLILPDTIQQCSSFYGGILNSSLSWYQRLEDSNIIISLEDAEAFPIDGDYITTALYAQSIGNIQRLIAVDRTKYFFSTTTPAHIPPTQPKNIEIIFNALKSSLLVIWNRSTDGDMYDNWLMYEVNYTKYGTVFDDALWQKPLAYADAGEQEIIHGRGYAKIPVEPNSTYTIGIRAKDDFGAYSSIATTTFIVPDMSVPYGISDIQWGHLTSSSTVQLSFSANPYPFMSSSTPSVINFYLNQMPPLRHMFSNNVDHLSVGGDNSVLILKYSTCTYGVTQLSGLIMHNSDACLAGSGLMKNATRNDLITSQTSFGSTTVAGVWKNENSVSRTFSPSDYITLGFYALHGNNFIEVARYPKPVYFKE